MIVRPCGSCVSGRTAALVAGSLNIAIGMSGLSLLSLSPRGRHIILEPLDASGNAELLPSYKSDNISSIHDSLYSDLIVEDTLKLFIEYLLPAVGILALGLVLTVAAITMNKCLTVFSFLLSTLIMAGCFSGLLSLVLSSSYGVDFAAAAPLILVAVVQFFVYWVVIDFNQFSWDFRKREDKEELVGDTTV